MATKSRVQHLIRPTPEEPMPAEPATMPEQEPKTGPERPTTPEEPDAFHRSPPRRAEHFAIRRGTTPMAVRASDRKEAVSAVTTRSRAPGIVLGIGLGASWTPFSSTRFGGTH
jgi:hypothetical protein